MPTSKLTLYSHRGRRNLFHTAAGLTFNNDCMTEWSFLLDAKASEGDKSGTVTNLVIGMGGMSPPPPFKLASYPGMCLALTK